MAKLMRGRKNTVRNFVLMLAGGLALGYLAIMVIGNPIVAAQLIPNDTPVVLLGGSVTLGEHSSVASQNWQSVTPQTEYAAPAGSPIATIVVKNNPSDVDGDGSTDRLRIPVPAGASWEIDLATAEVFGIAVKIQPDSTTPTNIDATAITGALCIDSGQKNLSYSHSSCNGPTPVGIDTFTGVTVKINNVSIGTLTCVNADGTLPNKCKIVLKT